MNYVVGAVILAAVGWIAWKAMTGGLSDAKFVVKVTDSGVTLKGSVPGKSDADVIEFVQSMELPAGCKIWGTPDRETLRLGFAGDIPANLQQRARNYFMN